VPSSFVFSFFILEKKEGYNEITVARLPFRSLLTLLHAFPKQSSNIEKAAA
jgi:hypothetical protein